MQVIGVKGSLNKKHTGTAFLGMHLTALLQKETPLFLPPPNLLQLSCRRPVQRSLCMHTVDLSHPVSGSHPLPVLEMRIAAEPPEASTCHIKCISCSSGPCPSCLSPDSDFSSSFICLQLISVRSYPHVLLCSEMQERTTQTQLCTHFPYPQRVVYSKSPPYLLPISNQMVSDSSTQPLHFRLQMQGDAGNRSAAKATEHCPNCPSTANNGPGMAPRED